MCVPGINILNFLTVQLTGCKTAVLDLLGSCQIIVKHIILQIICLAFGKGITSFSISFTIQGSDFHIILAINGIRVVNSTVIQAIIYIHR